MKLPQTSQAYIRQAYRHKGPKVLLSLRAVTAEHHDLHTGVPLPRESPRPIPLMGDGPTPPSLELIFPSFCQFLCFDPVTGRNFPSQAILS